MGSFPVKQMTENSDGVARRHDVNLEHVIGLHYNTETRKATPLQVPPIWLVVYLYDLRKFSHYMTARLKERNIFTSAQMSQFNFHDMDIKVKRNHNINNY